MGHNNRKFLLSVFSDHYYSLYFIIITENHAVTLKRKWFSEMISGCHIC